MTNINLCLEAVAKAIYNSERYPNQPDWDETFHKNRAQCFRYAEAALDALRAFDQAQQTAITCKHCGKVTASADEYAAHMNSEHPVSFGAVYPQQPQPESEVMPPEPERRSSLDNATAPVTGADLPWIGVAVETFLVCRPTEGSDRERLGRRLRAVLDWYNSRPPSEKEIDNAWCEAGLVGSPTTREGIARILIAAAKAWSGM